MTTTIPLTVKLTVGVDPDTLMKLVTKLADPNLGMHLLNTLTNHTQIESAQFRGLSFDVKNGAADNA